MSLRIVLFSGADPSKIQMLVSRIHTEAGECRVVGILYERRAKKPFKVRFTRFISNLPNTTFLMYVAYRLLHQVGNLLMRFADGLLHIVHAAPRQPNEPGVDLQELAHSYEQDGIAFRESYNMHSPEALEFVRRLAPDLGIVFGTGILKPSLFSIPRLGSVNVHKRKLPDYRGGGPVGLWEMLDGASEIGVSVHEVTAALDAGAIVASALIPIEPYDTLTSISLKADVVGNDLLVQAVRNYVNGTQSPVPQRSGGKMFRQPKPHDLWSLKRKLKAKRQQFRPPLVRPQWKLLLRTLIFAPYVLVRNQMRRSRAQLPLVVLYHHLVADRQHRMGISTEQFLRQIEFLQKHYRLVSLAEGIELLRSGRITVPTVALTFDDGYADNYINLRAVTEARVVPCTLFICPGNVEIGQPFEHDLKKGDGSFRPLTWNEVRAFNPATIEVGSHTHSHFDCGSSDAEKLRREIEVAKVELDTRLQRNIRYFSFPFGQLRNISPEAMKIACSCYETVFSAYGGTNYPGCDLRHIRRISHPASLWALELAIQGVLDFTTQATDGTAVNPNHAVPEMPDIAKPEESALQSSAS